MRDRIERCRRLARQTTDAKSITALNDLADEIEIDLRKLEAEAAAGGDPPLRNEMPPQT